MPLNGPALVVTATPVPAVDDALSRAGAFPVLSASWREAPAAAAALQPGAIVIVDGANVEPEAAAALRGVTLQTGRPFIPVVQIHNGAASAGEVVPHALLLPQDEIEQRLVETLRGAQRVRALHAAVLRRIVADPFASVLEPAAAFGEPLDMATVLVVGRGRHYAGIAEGLAGRTSVIGALSLDIARRHLAARDIDGIVLVDGLPPGAVVSFLEDCERDPDMRHLPVVRLAERAGRASDRTLMGRTVTDPDEVVPVILPALRIRAFSSRLSRILAALESEGTRDPATGLHRPEAFDADLAAAIEAGATQGTPLSLCRIALPEQTPERVSCDMARLVARMIRLGDFAMRENDGSVTIAFGATDLAAAQVVVRRIASVLKHSLFEPSSRQRPIDASYTLVVNRPGETLASILGRLRDPGVAAA